MAPLDTRTRAAAVLCGRTRVRGEEGKKLAILTEAGEDADAMVDRTRTLIATTVAKVGRHKPERFTIVVAVQSTLVGKAKGLPDERPKRGRG